MERLLEAVERGLSGKSPEKAGEDAKDEEE
jgi:hypothetical protein